MATTYTELLKLRMPALGDVGWDDEVNDNTEIYEFIFASFLLGNLVVSGMDPTDGGDLDVDIAAGEVVVAGAAYAVSATSKTCTSGVKNWLYVDDAGAVQIATSKPTGDYVALALIDAGSTTLVQIGDVRKIAEGALPVAVDYSPGNYTPDTGEAEEINQHMAGIDEALGFLNLEKNAIINGSFEIWQRGTSTTTDDEYLADRWLFASGDSCQRIANPDKTLVPCAYAIEFGDSAGGYAQIRQYIESWDAIKLAGKKLTLSLYVKSAAGNAKLDVRFLLPTAQDDYSGFSAEETVTLWAEDAQPSALTRYTATIDALTYTQLQYGLGIQFLRDSNATAHTTQITGVKLEVGEQATPFIGLPLAAELRRCQRFCFIDEIKCGLGRRYGTSGNYRTAGAVSFPVTMRTAPAATLLSTPTYSNCSGLSMANSPSSVTLRVTVTATGDYFVYDIIYMFDAEIT